MTATMAVLVVLFARLFATATALRVREGEDISAEVRFPAHHVPRPRTPGTAAW